MLELKIETEKKCIEITGDLYPRIKTQFETQIRQTEKILKKVEKMLDNI